MRRTVVHYVDTREFGGAERALQHLVAGLDQERWRPVLFHPDEPGLAPLLQAVRSAGVATRVVPPMRGLRSALSIPRFRALVRAERPAVFHAHLNWPLACSAGLLAAASAGVPAIVATAQLVSALPPAPGMPLQRRGVTRVVHRYLAVSNDAARELAALLRLPAHRIRVVHNAVPLPSTASPRAPAAGARPSRVLALTRLTPQKGLGHLLQATARLPDVQVVIAGEGPEREALEAQARALGIHDRVSFPGFRADTAALLAEADVVVLPSLKEGLPLAVLEAMAAGRPVVATAIGGTTEAVVHGETGLLVPPGDPPALAHALGTILADPALAARLGAGGRERVARSFSAERMVKAVVRVYDELLAPSTDAPA